MRQIVKRNQPFLREEVTRDEAAERLADQPFKLEIIEGLDNDDDPRPPRVTPSACTRNDGWADLCMGPHVPHTGMLGAFKLTNVAGAYWRGDETNPQLTRIYGTAWATQGRSRRLPAPSARKPSAAITASSAPSSICSRSPRRSGRGWRCSTRRAG